MARSRIWEFSKTFLYYAGKGDKLNRPKPCHSTLIRNRIEATITQPFYNAKEGRLERVKHYHPTQTRGKAGTLDQLFDTGTRSAQKVWNAAILYRQEERQKHPTQPFHTVKGEKGSEPYIVTQAAEIPLPTKRSWIRLHNLLPHQDSLKSGYLSCTTQRNPKKPANQPKPWPPARKKIKRSHLKMHRRTSNRTRPRMTRRLNQQ